MRLDGTCPGGGTCPVDITPNQCNQNPAWSPTQKQIVHNRSTSDPGPWAISIINADGTGDTPAEYDWPWLGQNWSLQNVIVFGGLGGLYIMNPDGSNGSFIDTSSAASNPSWFPGNGLVNLIAYDTCIGLQDCFQEIFVINADGGQPTQLTSPPANNWAPSWSPDGTRMVYLSDASGSSEVWMMNSDGSQQTELTFFSVNENLSPHWSQDGHHIVWLSSTSLPPSATLKIMNADGTNQYSYGPALPVGNTGTGSMDTTRCRRFDAL